LAEFGEVETRLLGEEDSVSERLDGRIVGTILFVGAALTRGGPWYDPSDVASVHQFAVDPSVQRRGLGTRLLELAERRASETGAAGIALDTSEHAGHLIDWYSRLGYRLVEHVDWELTNYRSVVMSKAVDRA
jgi:GNAT superfamily N-acetyltransferase